MLHASAICAGDRFPRLYLENITETNLSSRRLPSHDSLLLCIIHKAHFEISWTANLEVSCLSYLRRLITIGMLKRGLMDDDPALPGLWT